ncbi:ATP synthase F1 subunit epsilon [bacterium]|jgi:F-type H+-transporting ATPase subunit epsilon|nr:ATP synthase F1 subunit epsilon [bacterium]MBR1618266.1 ATP synthase F1 subunit epsilon [bacterium]
MNLKIITQEKVVFDSDVDEIYTRGVDGEFGILKGHVPVMAALDIGVTRVKINNETKAFTTMGGVLQFKDEECLILTTLAEPGEEIDEMRARESLERGRRLLKEANAKIDSKRVEASIARAKARLKAKLNDADV